MDIEENKKSIVEKEKYIMEYIYMFVEVDDSGKPIYKDEFLKKSGQNCTILATREYVDLLEQENSNIVAIPNEIMEEYDKNLETMGKRFILMEIYRNEKFENWLSCVFKENRERVEGIIIKHAYSSVVYISTENGKTILVERDKRKLSINSEEEYQKIINDMNEQIEELQEEVKQKEATVATLNDNLKSSNQYIENLQKHATNLDNDLKKYKAFYDQHNEAIQYAEERVKQVETEIHHYIDLYKNVLIELDEKKTELLELESKIGKH